MLLLTLQRSLRNPVKGTGFSHQSLLFSVNLRPLQHILAAVFLLLFLYFQRNSASCQQNFVKGLGASRQAVREKSGRAKNGMAKGGHRGDLGRSSSGPRPCLDSPCRLGSRKSCAALRSSRPTSSCSAVRVQRYIIEHWVARRHQLGCPFCCLLRPQNARTLR